MLRMESLKKYKRSERVTDEAQKQSTKRRKLRKNVIKTVQKIVCEKTLCINTNNKVFQTLKEIPSTNRSLSSYR